MGLYNNGYPASYTPMYQPYTPVQVQQQNVAPVQGGLNWVTGEAGAKAYLVAPNTTVALWDSEDQVVYLKSADASGMPSMKVLDYTIREVGKSNDADKTANYATSDDIEAINGVIDGMKRKIDKLMRKMREDEDE